MVIALIHWRDEGDREFLHQVRTIAVEFGNVELVEHLNELEKVDLNHGHDMYDFDGIHLRGVGKHIQRTFFESGCLYYYAFSDRLTPLNLAAKLGNVEVVNTLLACKRLGKLWCAPLHWAAKMGGHAQYFSTRKHNSM
jgi:hypothetical protein